MTQPDPKFVEFFAGEFQRRVAETIVPGMADASWDRKAAWLLWCAERSHASATPYTPPGTVIVTPSGEIVHPSNSSVFD